MSSDPYRYIGIIAFVLYWLTIIFLLRNRDYKLSESLSSYLAKDSRRTKLFAAVVTVETILYVFFFYGWLIPNFSLNYGFSLLVGIGLICHLLTSWFPSTVGIIKKFHWMVSYLTALSFIPAAVLLGIAENIPAKVRLLSFISFVIMVSIVMLSLGNHKLIKQFKLPLHLLYIFSFQCVWVLVAIVGVR